MDHVTKTADLVTQISEKYASRDTNMNKVLKTLEATTAELFNLGNRSPPPLEHSTKEFISQMSTKLGLPPPTSSNAFQNDINK